VGWEAGCRGWGKRSRESEGGVECGESRGGGGEGGKLEVDMGTRSREVWGRECMWAMRGEGWGGGKGRRGGGKSQGWGSWVGMDE